MQKSSKNKGASAPKSFVDRNIAAMAPAKAEKLIPTPQVPISLRKRMAGAG